MSIYDSNVEQYGKDQYLNFGKHKGKTVYEVANLGDLGYLNWLGKSEKMRPNCMIHIKSVLENQEKPGTWIQEETPDTDPNSSNTNVFYLKKDIQTNKVVAQSPTIQIATCLGCQEKKSLSNFSNGVKLCHWCQKKCSFPMKK